MIKLRPVLFISRRTLHQQQYSNPSIYQFFRSKSNKDLNDREFIENEQKKAANLGSMIEYLKLIIPESLNTVPDQSKLDENIQLRVSQTITTVPIIKGKLSYLTSLKATQLIFKNFVLNSNTKFHILKNEVNYSNKFGILGNGITKIIIHWKTCDENCIDLKDVSVEFKNKVLFGIYVFELNEMNDKILVHNVENVEICNGHEKKIDIGNLLTGAN